MLTKCKLWLMPPPPSTHPSPVEIGWGETGTMELGDGVPETAAVGDECIVFCWALSHCIVSHWSIVRGARAEPQVQRHKAIQRCLT